KLGDRTGRRFRLPTEAEWEHACRAGATTAFFFGPTLSTDQANYDGGGRAVRRPGTTPVGTFPPNAWGLDDPHGNGVAGCEGRYRRGPGPAGGQQRGGGGGRRVRRGGLLPPRPPQQQGARLPQRLRLPCLPGRGLTERDRRRAGSPLRSRAGDLRQSTRP